MRVASMLSTTAVFSTLLVALQIIGGLLTTTKRHVHELYKTPYLQLKRRSGVVKSIDDIMTE